MIHINTVGKYLAQDTGSRNEMRHGDVSTHILRHGQERGSYKGANQRRNNLNLKGGGFRFKPDLFEAEGGGVQVQTRLPGVWPQDGPKMAPRWPQNGPKMAPRWPCGQAACA